MRLRQGCRGWWIALLAAAADRVTKAAVVRIWEGRRLVDRTYSELIPGVVNIRLASNRGMAFSMFSGQTLALTVLTAVLILCLLSWLIARPDAPELLRAGLWLIAGGGLGNLFDRVVRGSVIDFIDLAFTRFAVFNVADICICAGAALAAIGAIIGEKRGERAKRNAGI